MLPVAPRGSDPESKPTSHRPAAVAAAAADTTADAERIPPPEYARFRPRPPRSFLSAPFAAAAAASRPVADRGEGNAKLTCAVQRARAEGRGLGLRLPEGAAGSGP